MVDTTFSIIDTSSVSSDSVLLNSILEPELILIESEKILGMSESLASIVIPAIISLSVFILGHLFIWYRGQKSLQNETENYRTIILKWIDLINMNIEKMKDACNNLSSDIQNSGDLQPERFEYVKILADKINSIEIDRFITTFIINSTIPKRNRKNEEMTFNLVGQFQFLTSIESEIETTYSKYQTDMRNFIDEWNELNIKLTDLKNTWAPIISGNNHPFLAFHNNVNHTFNTWVQNMQNGNASFTYNLQNLINPLIKITSAEINRNTNNDYAINMFRILQQIKIIEKKWNISKGGYSNLFSSTAISISNSHEALKDAKKYFEIETTVKRIWSI